MTSYLNKYNGLSKSAKNRIKWFDYYKKCGNVSKTCRYFGISRQCFYEWKARYNPNNLWSLEDKPTIPKRKRQPTITGIEEMRVVALRKKYLQYGKIKLAKIYQNLYHEIISSWKIQQVIKKYKLYPNPAKTAKTTRKRVNAIKKKRVTELKKKPRAGFLLCLDTIVIYWKGLKRYIFTAIDHYTKVAFARMYKQASSYNGSDFLNRLLYLTDGKIENIQTDNGSEFAKYFEQSCQKLELDRYYNRPHTPKDNPVNERFNKTLQDEFISLGNFSSDTTVFNSKLTDWLIEYNFHRPHKTLNYEAPIKMIEVSPRYSSHADP
jgi:transposase InsO family protein